jgi:outer membrane protein
MKCGNRSSTFLTMPIIKVNCLWILFFVLHLLAAPKILGYEIGSKTVDLKIIRAGRHSHYSSVVFEFGNPFQFEKPAVRENEVHFKLKNVKTTLSNYREYKNSKSWVKLEKAGNDLNVSIGLIKSLLKFNFYVLTNPNRLAINLYWDESRNAYSSKKASLDPENANRATLEASEKSLLAGNSNANNIQSTERSEPEKDIELRQPKSSNPTEQKQDGSYKSQKKLVSLSLEETINAALKANLDLKQAEAEVNASEQEKKARFTEFLPTFNTKYSYLNRDEPTTEFLGVQGVGVTTAVISPKDEYNFVTSFSQPIFTGFSLINKYKIASLGLDIAKIKRKVTRQNIILDAKNAYFSVLKAQKLLDVADLTVKQITSQKDSIENMYQVGVRPLNDWLQSQVQLANAKQRLNTAQKNLDAAQLQFNTLLIRPVNTQVVIVDILDFKPFPYDIDYCLAQAKKNRVEIQSADLEVQVSEKDYKQSQGDFYPTVNLEGNYYRRGTDWDVNGGEGIADREFWDIRATISWDFWEWGRTSYGVKEKFQRLSQAKYRQKHIQVDIDKEVKQAYLNTREAEQNIVAVEKAIDQAKENLRIIEEHYKNQVSTITDLLVAQTLLTDTMTNYYNALYGYKIGKAILYRAIGQEVIE